MITIVEMWLNSSIISCYSNNSYRNDVLLYRTYRGAGKIKILNSHFVYVSSDNVEFLAESIGTIYTVPRRS